MKNDLPRKLKQSFFVVFEGIDGVGKSTQVKLLADNLKKSDIEVVVLKEPTTGFWGQKIRKMAESGEKKITLKTELDWFIKDRIENVTENIRPALKKGLPVISDRYFYSNICYQSASGLDSNYIREKNKNFPIPDIVFLLELDIKNAHKRIIFGRNETPNQVYEKDDFLKKVDSVFKSLPDKNIIRLSAHPAAEEIAENVWQEVKKRFLY